MIKTAIIGYGHLGKWHVEKAIANNLCELVAVVDPSIESQKLFLEKHPDLKIVDNVEKIIDDIDAAFIVTPTFLHHELVIKLLKADKFVFCEKPLCSTAKEAREIQDLVKKRKSFLQVGHSERFHEIWKNWADFEHYIKGPSILSIERVASFKGRATDVDVVQDLMVHDLDLLYFLLGEKPITVEAFGYKIHTDKWDHVKAMFSFSSGKIAFLTVSRAHIEERRNIEIVNKNGCLFIDLMNLCGQCSISNSQKIEKFTYEKRDHLKEEHQSFFESIINKEPAIVNVNDGALAVELIEEVLRSIELGRPQDIS